MVDDEGVGEEEEAAEEAAVPATGKLLFWTAACFPLAIT
jgi:hypothetical protein